MKKLICITLSLALLIVSVPILALPIKVHASSGLSLGELQEKFPNGAYWNHYVSNTSECGDVLLATGNEYFANYVTWTPCASHSATSASYYVGKHDCNYFDGGIQCFGFARKLAYDAFGSKVSSWPVHYTIPNIKPGDVVRFWSSVTDQVNGHTVFVTGVSGKTITVGEANLYGAPCRIRWGGQYDLSGVWKIEIFSAPYTLGTGSVHTHSYTEYVHYWKDHPHYKCYKCSCGDIKENKSEPQYIESCQWCNPNYTIKYYGNGATSGSMSDQNLTYSQSANLRSNAFKREYTVLFSANGGTVNTTSTKATATFNGWEDRGSITYKGKEYSAVSSNTATRFDAAFYAKTNNDVFVSKDFGNGIYNKEGLLKHYYTYVVTGNERRPGYGSAVGLYPNSATVKSLANANGDIVPLYANWTLGKVSLPKPTRSGYTFLGWYTAASGGTKVGNSGAKYTPTKNITLYAHWQKNHTYKTSVTDATLTKNGKISYKCKTCGYVASTSKVIYRPTSFKLSTTTYTYNGAVKTPTVTVKDSAGKTLKKNTDYTVTYASGRKNVGTYKVTVKMKGNYTGTKTLYFKINPINISKCKVSLSTTSYTYNGKAKTPSVGVKSANGTTLKKNTHYTVTYASGRKNVGKYKVTIKMKGNYSGTKTLYFTIKPKAASINKLTAKSKALTVKLNRQTTQTTGYRIEYSTSKSFKNSKVKWVTNNKTSTTTLTGLKAKTTYYVRVRAYKRVNGANVYSSSSSYKYKKTK